MNYTIQRCITLTYRKSINFDVCRKISTNFILREDILTKRKLVPKLFFNYKNLLYSTKVSHCEIKPIVKQTKNVENYSSGQLKKRPKKRKSLVTHKTIHDSWNVQALSTSEEYNLEDLVQGLSQQKLYVPNIISTSTSYMPIQKDTEEKITEK